MPKIKISQLPAKAANLAATDLLEVSEVSGLTYVSKKITGSELVGNRVPYTGATTNVDLGEYELKAGQLTLDVSPTGTATVGTTRWNDTLGSSETTLKGGSVTLKNGVDLVARVVNKVSPNTTLTKATYPVVKVSGAQGQRLAVAYAQADSDNNSADTLGVVTETIATNQEGFILTVGQLEGINTTGSLQGESWADGHVLYLSPTIPGGITNIKPNGSTGHIVVIGYVEHSHAINGKIYVKIMNGWELDELHNVYINPATLVNDQVLTYESATQLWKNKTPNTGITVGTTSSTGTDGRVFFQAGGVVQQDGAFNWDNTNKRLGIGISTPSTILHVAGNYSGGLDALQPQMLVQNTNTTPAATKTSMIRVNVGTGYSGGYPEIWLESQQTAGGAGLTKIRTISNSPLLFYTNDLERARFSETGNFGIGAGASPGARLDVRAQGALSTDIAFRVRNSADTRNFLTVNGAGDVFNSGAQGVTGNTFYGENSGRSSTGAFNSFLGFEAGRDNSTGTNNCFFGVEAGRVNTTASGNSFFGSQAGRGNTGIYNSFFGASAGINNSTGTYNTFLGVSAGEGNSTGAFNSCLGFQAGQNNTTGSENVFSGVEAGRRILSGASLTVVNNSVFLGGLTRANANSETNQIVIGHSAIGLGSNTTVIGNTSTTRWKLFGAGIVENITAPSSSVTDSFHVYSNDITAGNAAPHFRTENGSIIKLYQNAAVTTTQGVADALTNLGLLASSTIAPTVQSVASAATVTPTFTNDLVKITAQAVALTLAAPTGTAIDGKDLMIRIKDNGTAQTIAWTSGTGGYRAIGVTLPTTTTAGKTTYVGLIYNSNDSIWDVIGVTTQA